MKSLRETRISLTVLTALIYQYLRYESIINPLALVAAFNLILLAAALLEKAWDIGGPVYSAAFRVSDVVLTTTYLYFMEPLWVFGFSSVLAFSLSTDEEADTRVFLYLLVFLSAAAILIRAALLKDPETPLLMFPSFAALLLFLRNQEEKSRKRGKDYIYLKKLVDNKNRLLSTLTHELRTPLAVIKTSNDLILEERPGPINDTQRSLLSSSMENTVRLTSLVENILSQVKVEFAWFSMKKKVLDIRPLVKRISVDISPFLETKRQSIRYNYPGLLSKTRADERWLQQVLLNLIHNGSKNSPEGSELEISVKENEQYLVVSVLDSGSGIANKEISRVFSEFYQSEDPAKDLTEGAGLGLTIVRDIVEKHGGQVYISSMPQKGTVVSFTLPVYKGALSEVFHSHS